MPLTFDSTKNFDANLDTFFESLPAEDADLVAILKANSSALEQLALADPARRRAARSAFNDAIKTSLDALLPRPEKASAK